MGREGGWGWGDEWCEGGEMGKVRAGKDSDGATHVE